jgi:signal peptidase II
MGRLSTVLCVFLLLAVVGCDHTTKHLAVTHLAERGPVDLLPKVLELRYVTNTDMAFSVLEKVLDASARFYVVLALQTIATVAVSAWMFSRWRMGHWLERSAGALVLGGALGNLSDRALRGHVIDFIHVSYWPVFNVADIAVCVGVGLLFLAVRRAGNAAVAQ